MEPSVEPASATQNGPRALKRGRPINPESTRQVVLSSLRKRGRARLPIVDFARPGDEPWEAVRRARDQLCRAARSAGIPITTYRDGDYVRALVIRRRPVQGLLRSAA